MKPNTYMPVLELTRGETVESIHYGAVAVVQPDGTLVASLGDPDGVAFLRSTAKPFQALPFIEAGGHTHFGFGGEEIALMCASHSGTDAHVAVAERMQSRAGLREEALQCGAHRPYDKATAESLAEAGEDPTSNRHNCSGKHSGMLAFAMQLGAPRDSYLSPDHPVQRQILAAFAAMCDMQPAGVLQGVDGCSAPNFAVPFRNAALAMARLADPNGLPPERAQALQTIFTAMVKHPHMVGGPGRFDTALMRQLGGRMASKGGAEGYEGVALRPGVAGESALGVVVKIADGDLRRWVTAAVTLEVLRQLEALTEADANALSEFGPRGDVHNARKLLVGESRPCFELVWA